MDALDALDALRAAVASPSGVAHDEGRRACRVALGIAECAVITQLKCLYDPRLMQALRLLPPNHAAALRMHFVLSSYEEVHVARAMREQPHARDLGRKSFVLYRSDSALGAPMATLALFARYEALNPRSSEAVMDAMRAITNGFRVEDVVTSGGAGDEEVRDGVRSIWATANSKLAIACTDYAGLVAPLSCSVVKALRAFPSLKELKDVDVRELHALLGV